MGAKYKLSLSMAVVCDKTGEKSYVESEIKISSFTQELRETISRRLSRDYPLEDLVLFLDNVGFRNLMEHAAGKYSCLTSNDVDGELVTMIGRGYSVERCIIESIHELN